MNTLGSHPGAILFRFGMLAILIVILIGAFLSYVEKSQQTVERASILQTKRIIDSALTVVFSTYAVKGRLADLNELNGANPFKFLEEYQGQGSPMVSAYRGEIDTGLTEDLAPGWYYLKSRRQVAYKAQYNNPDAYYSVVLNFDDLNDSGSFEPRQDKFRHLQFVEISGI